MNPEGGGYGRSLLWGALLGLAGIAALAGYLYYNASSTAYRGGVPEEVLVVGAVQDADGASVGGVIFMLDSEGGFEYVEATDPVTIPGTSYETLQDAYAFGGGASVAEAYGRLRDVETPAWLALPQDVWMAAVDEAGGVIVDVDEGVYVFLGKELVSIEGGEQELSGAELAAYWAAAPFADSERKVQSVRKTVSDAVADAVMAEWGLVAVAVDDGEATSLVPVAYLEEFGLSFVR